MVAKVFVRSAFNYDVDAASNESAIACDPDEGVTQQQFKEECDINTIVNRFGLTGELPFTERAPVSGDFTGISDFHTALNAVVAAEAGFRDLPAQVRARFHNDPGEMLGFLNDGKNREEAVRLGLVSVPPEKTRDVVAAVDELAAKMVPPVVKS